MKTQFCKSILQNIVNLSKEEEFWDLAKKFRKSQPAVFEFISGTLPFQFHAEDNLWLLTLSDMASRKR